MYIIHVSFKLKSLNKHEFPNFELPTHAHTKTARSARRGQDSFITDINMGKKK